MNGGPSRALGYGRERTIPISYLIRYLFRVISSANTESGPNGLADHGRADEVMSPDLGLRSSRRDDLGL